MNSTESDTDFKGAETTVQTNQNDTEQYTQDIRPLRGIHLQVQFAFVFPYVTPHCTISYLSLISFNFIPIAEMTGTLTALPAILYSRPSERPVAAAL